MRRGLCLFYLLLYPQYLGLCLTLCKYSNNFYCMNKWSFVAHVREWNRIYEMETILENPNTWLSHLHYISLIKCNQLNIKVIYSLLYKWKEKIHYYNWFVRNSWFFYTNEVKHNHLQKKMTKKNHLLSSCLYRRTQCSMSHVFQHIFN